MLLERKTFEKIQYELTEYGLSSLSRPERKVMATINAVLQRLGEMINEKSNGITTEPPLGFIESKEIYNRNIESVLGPKPRERRARIMVTLPTEAATDYSLVKELVANDVDCVRINCAHDNEEVWSGMIANVKKAREEFSTSCLIYMDLSGPKLRTAGIETKPVVQRAKPTRNQIGIVQQRVAVVFFREDMPDNLPEEFDVCIPVDADWLELCEKGDFITLRDARDSNRKFNILRTDANYIIADSGKTTYFSPGLELVLNKSLLANAIFYCDR